MMSLSVPKIASDPTLSARKGNLGRYFDGQVESILRLIPQYYRCLESWGKGGEWQQALNREYCSNCLTLSRSEAGSRSAVRQRPRVKANASDRGKDAPPAAH